MNTPKHSFIMWLAMQNRLLTKERAQKFMSLADYKCVICETKDENIAHLFCACNVVKCWLNEVKQWLGWKAINDNLQGLIRWKQRASFKVSFMILNILWTLVPASILQAWEATKKGKWKELRMILSKHKI